MGVLEIDRKRKKLYAEIDNLGETARLLENAEKIADRLKLPADVMDYLYAHSRCDLPRKDWDREVRVAYCIDAILRDYLLRVPLSEFNSLIDQAALAAAIETSRDGATLLLAYHGAFRFLLVKLFNGTFREGMMIRRGNVKSRPTSTDPLSAQSGAHETLFIALRALMERRPVFIAPDGPFGTQKTNINVLNATCPVADGAAFLAYESKCKTAWFTIVRGDAGFAPVVELGPRRHSDESFAQFRSRLYQFYEEKLRLAFTGDPRNLVVPGRWMVHFRTMLANRT